MQNKISPSTPCESAAVKVDYWFGKDKALFLGIDLYVQKPKDFLKAYKCDLVKTPRIPVQAEYIPLYGYSLSKKKRTPKQRLITKEVKASTLNIQLDSAHCSINQKYPHCLSSDRVVSWHLKEHFFVCKRLKLLGKQLHPGPKRHDVVLLQSIKKEQGSESSLYIEEWKKIQKDRQFPVSHITT